MAIWIMLTRLLIHATCNFLCYFTCVSERNVQVVLIQIFVNCCHMNSFLFYYIHIARSLIQNLQSMEFFTQVLVTSWLFDVFTWHYARANYKNNKLQQNNTKKTLKMISCRVIPKVSGITLHFIEIHPNFHMSYDILLRKYKNVMITL